MIVKTVYGFRLTYVRIRFALSVVYECLKVKRNIFSAFEFLVSLVRERVRIHGNSGGFKAVRANDKYYWSINVPGFPSEPFHNFIANEFLRINDPSKSTLQTIIFAITNLCPLRCLHCYESENLRDHETMSLADLKMIMNQIAGAGISHVQFSGGEPVSRLDDMLELMKLGGGDMEYWINTSGFGLTHEIAGKMAQGGMTGAIISLDDWNEERHNHIRQNDKSFRWALEAAKNCSKAGLIVCISVCAHKEFVTEENLSDIHLLSHKAGASFLRILEPRRSGNYSRKDVSLSPSQFEIIQNFMLQRNRSRRYRDFPVIQFPSMHSRKYGCLGAGNRYIYIDPDGNYHPCPFCRVSAGNVLTEPLHEGIPLIRKAGCQAYKQKILI